MACVGPWSNSRRGRRTACWKDDGLLLANVMAAIFPMHCSQHAVRCLLLALALLLSSQLGHAQDIEPRRWSHMPTAANFGGAAYAYTLGDILFDPAMKIENAEFELQSFVGKYIHSFEFFGKSARVDLTQSYQVVEWTGLLDGTPARVEREGWADTSLRFAVNLLGAPPLAGKKIAAYRASMESETIVGLGLVLQLPIGQ
jgi:hypothetical protein